jgi:hypothetical protein
VVVIRRDVQHTPEGYGEAIRLTMDSPIDKLIEEPQVWQVVQDVFGTHLPEVPLDQAAVSDPATHQTGVHP